MVTMVATMVDDGAREIFLFHGLDQTNCNLPFFFLQKSGISMPWLQKCASARRKKITAVGLGKMAARLDHDDDDFMEPSSRPST